MPERVIVKIPIKPAGKFGDKLIGGICGGLIAFLLIITSLDIIGRTIWGNSINWAQQAAEWSMLIMAFLGAGSVILGRRHINIGAVSEMTQGKLKKCFDIIAHAVIIIFGMVLVISSIGYIAYIIDSSILRQFGTIMIPYWPIVLFSATIGGFLIIVYGVVMLIRIVTEPPHIEV